MLPANTEFDVIFIKRDEVLNDERNTEFRVSFGEAPADERDSINELRRLSMQVKIDVSTSFMTS